MNNPDTVESPPAPCEGTPKNRFGGKQKGAGRKPLPLNKKRRRVVVYVEPCVEEWVEDMGGNKFAARILSDAHTQSLIV